MTKRYFQMKQNGDIADIDIYGDIEKYPWLASDVSSYSLAKQLEMLDGVNTINVHINSYGGDVAEGLAIYNALRRNPARVVTTCDGMACSIASVIMMAGDERIMADASLLMIHNAWLFASGDANELRKQADDLDVINNASKTAYLSRINIGEDQLSQMMDSETWITPEQALEMGFITSIMTDRPATPSQSAIKSIMRLVRQKIDIDDTDPDDDDDDKDDENPSGDADDNDQTSDGEATDEDPDDPDGETDSSDDGSDPDEDPDDETDEDPDDPDKKPSQSLTNFISFLTRKDV